MRLAVFVAAIVAQLPFIAWRIWESRKLRRALDAHPEVQKMKREGRWPLSAREEATDG